MSSSPWDWPWQTKIVEAMVTKYNATIKSGTREEDFMFIKRATRIIMAVRS